MEIKEIIDLVSELNYKYYEDTKDDEYQPFDFSTNGGEWDIKFAGNSIICSARDSYDEFNNITTLKNTIDRKSRDMVKNLRKMYSEFYD